MTRGRAWKVAVEASQLWRRLAFAGYVLPAGAVYGLFVLWPLLRVVWLSFTHWDGYTTSTPAGLSNYGALLTDPGFQTELGHSLTWLAVTLAVPVLLGLGLALLLARAPARLAAVCRALLLTPLLLPSAVIAVAWKLIYNPLNGPLTDLLQTVGLTTTPDWLGDPSLALGSLLAPACWAAFGLSLLVFGAALAAIGREAREAAAIDGAGAWARFRHLTLPHLRHALPLATVATALCAVPSFDLVSLLTNGGPGYATTTLELDMEGRAFSLGQVGSGAAVACVAALIGLALSGAALVAVRGYEQGGEDDVASQGRDDARRPGRGRWASAAALVAATALTLAPLLWLVARASQPDEGGGTPWAHLAAVWSGGFGAAFATSAIIAVAVTAATVALAVPAAFALSQARSRAGRIARAVAVVLLAVGLFQPTEVVIIPLFTLLRDLGLLNSAAGVILPEIGRAVPLAVLLLWGALRGLPAGVLEAATVDGAAPRQVLWRVALPLARPMVAVVALWAFLSSWNEYLLPTLAVQDDSLQTVPVALGHFIGRIDTQYALIATGALLAAAPLLIVYAAGYGMLGAGVRRLRPTRRQEA
ncbi:MAG: ABC transporter permease subunit [Chloroflexi bacterium]|nr:ABC transporter permease subunit [Chloroflexota bacterium]